ncbi:MAG: LPP20 family lipoprotein [Gammaproteobacteria bacterium]|nr:LPP20 family lipoprotein [Gammaproteobacteria bacterium]
MSFQFPANYSRFFMLLTLFVVIGLSACGGKSNVKSGKENKNSQPDWVLNTPVEAGFLYGVGSAEVFGGNEAGAISLAKDMARAELIKQIKVNVTSEVSQEIEEIVKNGESELNKKLRKAVKSQVPEFKLRNVKATETHKNKNHVSVLVQLDVAKELQILRQQIMQLDMQIDEFQQKFTQTNPKGMSAVRLISPVLVLVDQRGELQSQHNALAQKSAPLIPMEIRDFVASLYERVAQLTVSIEAEGEKDDSLKTGLIASLTEKGMRISDTGQSDLIIVYKLKVNNVKKGDSYYAITNGDIWIKDETGKVIKAFQTKAKGVSGDATEAQSRSVKKLSSQLGQEMMSALF